MSFLEMLQKRSEKLGWLFQQLQPVTPGPEGAIDSLALPGFRLRLDWLWPEAVHPRATSHRLDALLIPRRLAA